MKPIPKISLPRPKCLFVFSHTPSSCLVFHLPLSLAHALTSVVVVRRPSYVTHLLLQWIDFHQTWYVASGTRAYHSLTLTYLTGRSNLVSFAFVWGVKDNQRPGTDAIRTKVPPSKPKWEITKITISPNTKRTYGKPNEQLSPKRWPLSYLTLTKYHLDTQKVKIVQKLTPKQAKTDNQFRSTALERSVLLIF